MTAGTGSNLRMAVLMLTFRTVATSAGVRSSEICNHDECCPTCEPLSRLLLPWNLYGALLGAICWTFCRQSYSQSYSKCYYINIIVNKKQLENICGPLFENDIA